MTQFLTRQEIFDQVAVHLLTQNERSKVGTKCAYRGNNGLKCALGVLIKDEFFNEEFNNTVLSSTRVQKALEKSGVDTDGLDNKLFLCSLQEIHDHVQIMFWFEQLEDLAKSKCLNTLAIEKFRKISH